MLMAGERNMGRKPTVVNTQMPTSRSAVRLNDGLLLGDSVIDSRFAHAACVSLNGGTPTPRCVLRQRRRHAAYGVLQRTQLFPGGNVWQPAPITEGFSGTG